MYLSTENPLLSKVEWWQKGITDPVMGFGLGHFGALRYFDGVLKEFPEQVSHSELISHLPLSFNQNDMVLQKSGYSLNAIDRGKNVNP